MDTRLTGTWRRSGFTLIEILVVAIVISILSAIALISVQSFMERTRLRVVIGETYQIATAMSFARDDLGLYVKPSFLILSKNELGLDDGAVTGANPINPALEYFGNDVSDLSSRILTNWAGPYMGLSAGRNDIGGPTTVRMVMPGVAASDRGGADNPLNAPGDVWNQPYILYLMDIDRNGDPFFINGVGDYTTVPGFFAAVVSYGQNRVPGGEEQPVDKTNTPILSEDLIGRIPARLYVTLEQTGPGGGAVPVPNQLESRVLLYGALPPISYNTTAQIQGYYALIDRNSDDIIKEF
jgi:prepilin-type N-terminal cleavage/methylation domain-containing protein